MPNDQKQNIPPDPSKKQLPDTSSQNLDKVNTDPSSPQQSVSDGSLNIPSQTQDTKADDNQKKDSKINEPENVIVSSQVPKKYGGTKVIATIFGILFLIGAIGAGVFLVQRQQNIRKKAQEVTTPETITPAGFFTCIGVNAYDTNWNPLSLADLETKKVGEIVRFATSANTSYGSITKAMFSINNTCVETTNYRIPQTTCITCSNEFYYDYTIPSDTASFTINAKLYVEGLGWTGEGSNFSCSSGILPTMAPSVD